MSRIETDPGELDAGGRQQQAIAVAVTELAGTLHQVGAMVGEAAGHPGAGAAAGSWGTAWGTAVASHGADLHRAGGNLGAAAEAYRETDDGAMRT